jgi:hypothetical protein
MEGKGSEEGEGNKGPNLVALKRRKRETETELYSLDDAHGFFFLSLITAQSALDCPTMETRRESPFFFFF